MRSTLDAQVATKPTPRGPDRFLGGSVLVLGLIFVVLMVMAGQVTPFWLMPAVAYFMLGAAITRRAGQWLLVAAIVTPVLQVGTSLPFMAPGLAHPETPASFLPDVFIIIASIVVVAGAVPALRRSTKRVRRPIAALAMFLAAAAVVASVVAVSGVSSDTRQPGDVALTAAAVDYPERVEASQGASLWVDNQDLFRHTFVIKGTDVRAELPGATAVRLETNLRPASYRFFCDVPGHEDAMQGVLYVK